jgi:hypothetical protein
LQLIGKENNPPKQYGTKYEENGTGKAGNKQDISRCKATADFSGQYHFCDICQDIKRKTGYKNDYPVSERIIDGECSGGCQPESDYAGIKRVNKEPRGKNLSNIPFSKREQFFFRLPGTIFFEEYIKETHYHQKDTTHKTNGSFVFEQSGGQFRKGIA